MQIKEAIQTIIPGVYCQLPDPNFRKSEFQILVKHSKGGIACELGHGDSEEEAWAHAAVTINRKFQK